MFWLPEGRNIPAQGIYRMRKQEYHFLTIRHSGESRNLVKTIVYWMPFFNGMTVTGFI